MKANRKYRRLIRLLLISPVLLLSGCSTPHFWLIHPKGPVAGAELHFMIIDVVVMLGIILPTAALLVWFVWRYRESRPRGKYDSHWASSPRIEAVMWGIPLLAVGLLSYFSFVGIHDVNPYNPGAVTGDKQVSAHDDPLEVDVISTDWQWVFVYPAKHIATLNKLVVPVNTPVHFRLTSATVTNSFFIPELVGQIYAMPGMRTKQTMLVQDTGTYPGFSATLSGPGFSWMHFQTKAVPRKAFSKWVAKVKGRQNELTYASFNRVARPTINLNHTVKYYARVQKGLFQHVIQEVKQGKVFSTRMGMTSHM